jgi:hypothetical protein
VEEADLVADCRPGRRSRSTVLTVEEEAIIVAFRRHTLLPLDDCLYALQATIPHLTRSSLHRCLQRHGISRLPEVEGDKPAKKKFKSYPIGFFHIDIAEVQTAEGKLYLYVAIDRTSQVRLRPAGREGQPDHGFRLPGRPDQGRSLQDPHVLTDNGIQFRFPPRYADGPTATLHDPHVRYALPRRTASSTASPSQPSLDQRPGRADEPHHQGRHRQALSLRRATPSSNGTSPTSSPPTTSAVG